MKSNELRIGNLISRLDIGNSEPRIESVIELRKDKVLTSGPISVICGYDEINGIQLTEELLLKLGFKKELESDNAIFYENDFISINTYKGYNSTFLKRNRLLNQQDYSINNIKYVHQLQNLYFSLTGEELTIKE